MTFKFVALLAFIASASAGVIPSGHVAYSAPVTVVKAAPVAYAAPASYSGYRAPVEYVNPQKVAYEYAQPIAYRTATAGALKSQLVLSKATDEYDPHPQYKFGYDVQDAISGDSKSQVESRDGDVVQGEYSLIDADGFKRIVHYTADSVHGFNAVVSREPINVAVKTVPTSAVVNHVTPVANSVVPSQLPYLPRSGHGAYVAGPVVKEAYAATPDIKATPIAFPISEEH